MIYLTRRERFSAAHKLWNVQWTNDKNLEAFGKCSNPNWHGHNYQLFVTVKGIQDKETGFVMNLKTLSELIKKFVIDEIDHKNIDTDTDILKGKISTTENIAVAIWERLAQPVANSGVILHCVKLSETENNTVEYYGETNL